MTTIMIYDDTAEVIEKLAEKHDSAEWDVIDDIIQGLTEEELDNLMG